MIVVINATTNAAPARALTSNGNGTYTLTLNDMATGIPALNAKLAQLGIRETVVPITVGCKAASSLLSIDPVQEGHGSINQTVTVGNQWIPAGWHGFMAAKQMPGGQVLLAAGTTPQPIPRCFPATPHNFHPASGMTSPAPPLARGRGGGLGRG